MGASSFFECSRGSIDLPVPTLPGVGVKEAANATQTENQPPTSTMRPSMTPSKQQQQQQQSEGGGEQLPRRSRGERGDTLDFPETDPWASPALHRGHSHSQGNGTHREPSDSSPGKTPTRSENLPSRTTSNFTTGSTGLAADAPQAGSYDPPVGGGDGWGGYVAPDKTGFSGPSASGIGQASIGDAGNDDSHSPAAGEASRAAGSTRVFAGGVEEVITITALPEKEGIPFFQHRNYQVSSARRGSKVVRRYSDFVWLLDCLYKRYPFRQLPLLPPKRVAGKWQRSSSFPARGVDADGAVAVNGNHLLSDASFIEKRRRGLVRFTNALVRHPVLNQEQLVIMFLTVPTVSPTPTRDPVVR